MTEFTSADGVLRKKDPEGKTVSAFSTRTNIRFPAQLFGSDPAVMAEAAKMVEGLGIRHC